MNTCIKDYGCYDRTSTTACVDEGKLTGILFRCDGFKTEVTFDNPVPYSDELSDTLEEIASLYDSEDCVGHDAFEDALPTAHTLSDVLELLDGTFDYNAYYKSLRDKGFEILLAKHGDNPKAMLEFLDHYDTVNWARFLRFNA